jgi:hypothetical protein
MKLSFKYALSFVFSLFVVSSSGQTVTFSLFISNFQSCNLPIDTKTYFNSQGIHANNSIDISETEYNRFLIDKNEKFWIYSLYSKNKTTFFNYVRGCKIGINEKCTGIMYFRDYSCDNPLDEKAELVFCILDNNGNLISALPISGNQGDDLSYESVITDFKNIKITFEQYSKDKKKTYNKFYFVTDEGLIKEINK